ncbi:snoRNA-binding protein [Kappamyces sp. JEL0680]|nr:snoRNA-binding protein [Kappamyces sp. JEL0680]
MGKSEKKEKKETVPVPTAEEPEIEYEERLKAVSPIAHPLAPKKLNKKILKLVRKASKASSVKRGVKEVVKGLRKNVKGIVVIAGDISPIDVITHVPVLCEDSNVPYIFVPSKEELGSAGSTKRPTSVVMVVLKKEADFADSYKEIFDEVKLVGEAQIRSE